MTHIVHPYSHRIGIIRGWKSRWFLAGKAEYREQVRTDGMIRSFLEKRLRNSFVADIQVERSRKAMKIQIYTSRPGMIIGRSGEGAIKLKKDLLKDLKKKNIVLPVDLSIDVVAITDPESNAGIIAWSVVEGLEKRMPFRRVMKQAVDKVMAVKGVQGVKIVLSGRLGGAEMSRKEELKKGRMALQTLRSDIDYCQKHAYLSYGVVGVKVWIYKGDVLTHKKVNHD